MRTTVDLPEEIHNLARQLAHEANRSMSEVIADLIRLGMNQGSSAVEIGTRGLPQVSVGRPITAQDVRSLEDDE